MNKITFIGLGTMGFHMAKHLAIKSIKENDKTEICVFNRNQTVAQSWLAELRNLPQHQIKQALTIKDAVINADIIFMCVGKDEDVLEVCLTDKGVLQNAKAGAYLIDHTTTSYKLTQTINEVAKKHKIHFIDAPVSGGEVGAETGTLSVMAGGEESELNQVKALINCYAAKITLTGEIGTGQLTKMVNQICISNILQGLSDAIRFTEANKLDINKTLEAISGGAAASWQMQNRTETMHNREFDFGFAIEWMCKDLQYALEQAKNTGVKLSSTAKVLQKYQGLVKDGKANLDTSSLILWDEKNDK